MLYTGRGCGNEKIESYSSWKKRKFEHDKQKLLRLFSDIKSTSLKEEDQIKLTAELKKIAAAY